VLADRSLPFPVVPVASAHPGPPADRRPPEVADSDVLAAVRGSLDRCFGAATGLSWTCPRLDDARQGVWQVRGDPLAGATVHYDGAGDFTVAAHFVAVETATTDSSAVGVVDGAPLQARAHWDGEALRVSRLDRVASGPQVPRTARGDDASLIRLAGLRLGWCSRQNGRDVHQGCPSHLVPPAVLQACPDPQLVTFWKESADPASGATVAYDGATGIYRVTGRYSLEETFVQPVLCRGNARRQGAYSLVIVFERDREGASVPAYLQFAWT
jgi:hypothetical protein